MQTKIDQDEPPAPFPFWSQFTCREFISEFFRCDRLILQIPPMIGRFTDSRGPYREYREFLAVGSIDALICATASLRGWQLFTRDKDSEHYGKVLSLQFHSPA
jgi:hypothetical protein